MDSSSKSSSATLFNNPTLSDVKLKQIYDGKVREYHAHKAILCKESGFFLKAFTGNFKEATENTMTLYDDDPENFEFILKFIYSDKYDKEAIIKLAVTDKNKRILIPMGIFTIADKYDILKVYKTSAEDVKATLLSANGDTTLLKSAIQAHYGTETNVDEPMGRIITSVVFKNYRAFSTTTEFENALLSYPVLAADIAVGLKRANSNIFQLRSHKCRSCPGTTWVDTSTRKHFYCVECGTRSAWVTA